MSGTIRLLDYMGEMVVSNKYTSKSDRGSIIDRWKRTYGKGFNRCFIQIFPDTNPQLVDKDGLNLKEKPLEVLQQDKYLLIKTKVSTNNKVRHYPLPDNQ